MQASPMLPMQQTFTIGLWVDAIKLLTRRGLGIGFVFPSILS